LLNRSFQAAGEARFHLDLLKLLERESTIFSKCALKSLDPRDLCRTARCRRRPDELWDRRDRYGQKSKIWPL